MQVARQAPALVPASTSTLSEGVADRMGGYGPFPCECPPGRPA